MTMTMVVAKMIMLLCKVTVAMVIATTITTVLIGMGTTSASLHTYAPNMTD